MQLDKSRIRIRERNHCEVLDLALRLLCVYWRPLLLAAVIGIAPWVALNTWLLSTAPVFEVELEEDWVAFGYWYGLLIFLELPLATAPMTLVLGQLLFLERVDGRRAAREFFRSLPQLLLLQGLVRVVLAPLVITLLIPLVGWPYLSEVILLERNPGRRGSSNRLTTWRRSRALHREASGDLFGRWISSIGVGTVLVAAVLLACMVVAGQFQSFQAPSEPVVLASLRIALWITLAYFAVVRFLAYLDLRIRREGWEVELALRAEAARMAQQLHPGA